MIGIRETYLLRITFNLSILLISVEMCRAIAHGSHASKTAWIGLRTIEKRLKNQSWCLTGMFYKRVG